jgi:peptidoglycan/LPS O-acetylase OafA/YrhL
MKTPAASRIPSLDGLRALSICAVLLGHLSGTRGLPHVVTSTVHNPYVDVAHLGVRVFFVISGFLITGLLVQEAARTGHISLTRFYLRRTMRIFPAYFTLLAVIALLSWKGILHVPGRDLVHAVTYTVNYAPDRVWWIGHLWSLAVEEQFYLVWPAVVVLAGVRRSWRVALAVICVVPLIRVVEAMIWPSWQPMIDTTFDTTADALAIGCLLALTRDMLISHRWYSWAVASRWVSPALLLVGLAASIRYRPGLLIGETFVNVAIAIGIDRCVRRPEGLFGRVLNARSVAFIGSMSYSLYLWQQLFLNRSSTAAVNAFPLNIGLAVLCAFASFYAVEQPMLLKVRPRIDAWLLRRQVRTPGVALPAGWHWPTPNERRKRVERSGQ